MKIRHLLLLVASLALLAAGCGSDDDSKSEKKLTKAEKALATDQANKTENVEKAESAFEKASDDAGACRNLAMAWIAKASPASSTDPKKPAELPKDRDKSLKEAVGTLEKCVKIDGKDRGAKQMLASTYMALADYDKATPLLKQLAQSAKGDERPNAFYAWGLAATNAQDYAEAISAWNSFVDVAPAKDPRIDQVRQSIKSLRAAAKQARASASQSAKPASDDKGGENEAGDDNGGEDEPGDDNGGDDS